MARDHLLVVDFVLVDVTVDGFRNWVFVVIIVTGTHVSYPGGEDRVAVG